MSDLQATTYSLDRSVPAVLINLPILRGDIQSKQSDAGRFTAYLQRVSELPQASAVICERDHFDAYFLFLFDGVSQREAMLLVAQIKREVYEVRA